MQFTVCVLTTCKHNLIRSWSFDGVITTKLMLRGLGIEFEEKQDCWVALLDCWDTGLLRLRKEVFALNCWNINKATGIKLSFSLWIKFQKGLFFSHTWPFFQLLIRPFWASIWMGLCIYRSIDLRTGKKTLVINYQNINKGISIQLTLTLPITVQKGLFSSKFDVFFQLTMRLFWVPARIRLKISMPWNKKWKKSYYS